jgi:predicted ATPase
MKNSLESITTLTLMFNRDSHRNIFKNYIEYIRFPLFKKFNENMKIDFTFPITFLVGQNGSGKSSVLQALYGAPMNKSTSDFWFSTEVDPIGPSHCYIYSFLSTESKLNAEVLKIRRSNRSNPDYWEPARPQMSLQMNTEIPSQATGNEVPESRERWSPLIKTVSYMDFRYELSAFDKYFYFGEKPKTITMRSKQDYLRRYAKPLKIALGTSRYTFGRRRSLRIILSAEAIEIISYILGKAYTSAMLIEHDFFKKGTKDFSVYYTTEHGSYSEAFSGSGETAVVRLVQQVLGAPNYALLLLDEPETSLHPGAQKKLIQFILDQTIKKKLQVVISTHSSHIIEDMPKESIKVFTQDLGTGYTTHLPNIRPEEAFFYIGNTISYKKLIVVEDLLAKQIIEYVLRSFGEQTANLFEVRFYTGGAPYINQQLIPVFCKEELSKKFIIFDGDQKPADRHINPNELNDTQKTIQNLSRIVRSQTKNPVKFYPDGGENGGREDQEIELHLEYLTYYFSNVSYLPQLTPEEIIWSDEMLAKLDSDEVKRQITSEECYKNKFKLFSENMFGDASAETIKITHKMFIKKLPELNSENLNNIRTTVQNILDSAPYIFG